MKPPTDPIDTSEPDVDLGRRGHDGPPGEGRTGVQAVSRVIRSLFHHGMRAMLRLTGPVITCKELTDFLSRYVEDALTADEQRAFDRHVSMCRACRAYVDSYRRTIELEGLAFGDPDALAPADVPEELVQGILAARRAAR